MNSPPPPPNLERTAEAEPPTSPPAREEGEEKGGLRRRRRTSSWLTKEAVPAPTTLNLQAPPPPHVLLASAVRLGTTVPAHQQVVVEFALSSPTSVSYSLLTNADIVHEVSRSGGGGAAAAGEADATASAASLQLRDLRIVEHFQSPSPYSTPAVLVRHGCVVFHVPPLRCVLLPHRALFIPPPGGIDAAIVTILHLLHQWFAGPERRAESEFAAAVLEAALLVASHSVSASVAQAHGDVLRVSSALHSHKLPTPIIASQLRHCKAALLALASQGRELVAALDSLLQDPLDVEAVAVLSGSLEAPPSPSASRLQRGTIALQSMISSYAVQFGEQVSRCGAFRDALDADIAARAIVLDQNRNRLLMLELTAIAAAAALGLLNTVCAVFGMNLNFGTAINTGYTTWLEIIIISTVGCVLLLAGFMYYIYAHRAAALPAGTF